MKIAKKIGLVLGIFLLLIIGAALIVPLVFKDELVALAKEQINENINAEADFDEVKISLFRRFPNVYLGITNFSITGVERFEGLPLAKIESLDLTINLWSLISGPVEVRAVNVERPDIFVYVLRDGTANYNIALATEDTAAVDTSNFEVSLRRYSITDGNLVYDDRSTQTLLRIRGLNHQGSGNFTRDLFDLKTQTTIDSISVDYAGIAYLKNAKADLDAIFEINQPESKYTLKDNLLTVNEFKVNGNGFVQLDEDNYNMDLHLEAPENDFKNLFSLIPNAYIAGYEDVKTTGRFQFSSDIKGTYNGEREEFPSFTLNMEVDDGSVKYPDLPLGITDIQAKMSINSPSSDFDDMVIDISQFLVRVGKNPFAARLHLETPISDPDLDGMVDGVINLRELQQAYPMEGMETLAGVIAADIKAKTRLSYIEQKAYERVNLQGAVKIDGLRYKGEGLPLVVIDKAAASFTPQQVRINNFEAKLGKSDIQASGTIDNVLAYISPKKTMTGNLTLRSNYFNVDEWYGAETESETAVLNDTTQAAGAGTEIFDRFNFLIDAQAKTIEYTTYRLENTQARGQVAPNRLDIVQASTLIGDSDFEANGTITNIFDYLYSKGVIGGRINLRSKLINLNQFMTEDGETAGAPAEVEVEGSENLDPIVVPPNINLAIAANVGQVKYSNLNLRNVNGTLQVANEAVVLQDVKADGLGGQMAFEGGYDTKDPKNPAFNMKFDLSKLKFQEAFQNLNTFQLLAPIAQFISGTFSSSLIMDGTLTENLMPKLSSLNVQGFLETLDAIIHNFTPLEAMSKKLNADFLANDWAIKNSRNWFEVKNGMVEVKPFDIKVKDVAMTISGQHAINQKQMDYDIKASIPRQLLRQSGVGQAADRGVGLLQSQATKLGINFQQGEFINVLINLGGSIKQPQVGLNLLGTGGENTIAESAKEQLRDEIKEQVSEGRAVVEEKGKEVVDSAKAVARQQFEKAKDEARKQAESVLKGKGIDTSRNLAGDARKAAEGLIDSTGKKNAEDIKKELERFNPFKKKKEEPKKSGGN